MTREELQRERRKQERIKRQKRKNMIIYVETLLILVLTVALIVVSVLYVNAKNDLNEKSEGHVSSDAFSTADDTVSENDAQADYLKAEADKWYLLLVNPDNSISNDFISSVDRIQIKQGYHDGTDSGKYLDSRVVDIFNQMCNDAAKDGIKLWSESAYRTYAFQESLFNNKVQRLKNQGMSHDEAVKETATMIAKPGTSEHHLGLAVDLNLVDESFENTKEFRWLQENAEKYGFVMRYPKDKQDITKIIYEPWHYRYVGEEHAKAMNELDMCLEEYVEYLKSGGVKK